MQKWFPEARFGMFIHWGIYAQAGRGEWARFFCDDYGRPEQFDPKAFDPDEWAKLAWNAGMRYVVFTTKHHDGFCMFDSRYTDYKVTNTPFGRDVTRMVVNAFRAKGFRIGLYHSLIDWHHPDYLPDLNDPRGKDGRTDFPDVRPGAYPKYLYDSVEQLMTEYGKIDLLYWDYCTRWKSPSYYDPDRLLAMIYARQPEIIMNDRMTFNRSLDFQYIGDYRTPECALPSFPPSRYWETCATTNSSWGYVADDKVKKPASAFMVGLMNCVALNGNLLLNFGPDADGRLPEHGVKVLRELAEWYRSNGEAVAGCGPADYRIGSPYCYTQKGDALYLYFPVAPMGHVMLPELRGESRRAILLRTGEEAELTEWGVEHSPPGEIRLIPPASTREHDVIRIELGEAERTQVIHNGSAQSNSPKD